MRIPYVNKNYLIHDIPQDKRSFIFAGDQEYESGTFDFISKTEGREILKIFGGRSALKKHCKEMVDMVREERGKISLKELEELPQ